MSATFLILLGLMNLYILYKLVQQLKIVISQTTDEEDRPKVYGGGLLFRLSKKTFKVIDR